MDRARVPIPGWMFVVVSAVVVGAVAALGALAARGTPADATAGGAWTGFFDDLMKVYTPRRQCMYYEAPVIWLHFVSDLLITIAYYSIPVALIYFVHRRKDLAYHWIFWLFAAFILACGTTHLFGVIDLWQPVYRLDGLVRFATAAISIPTAIVLWPLIPRALALPSPAALERQVAERTHELRQTNERLQAEVDARRKVEHERERLLEAERVARTDAEHANRMKDEFLATVSHELRTPLNAIAGWAQLLGGRPDLEPEMREGLEVIDRNTRAQVQLIEDLLDVSRIAAGQMRIEPRRIDVRSVLESAHQSASPAIAAKAIRLEMDLPSAPALIFGDPVRLQQVAWNLLSNAVKFTDRGGHVRVSLAIVNEHVELTVADNGVGIAADLIPFLFQRFRQADSSITRRYGGLGLGLAISRYIVELHGGTVSAQSDGPGKGATFRVRLPLLQAEAGPTSASPASGGARRPLQTLRGVRVTVVDDDADAREIVARILQQAGAETEVLSDGASLLAALSNRRPDVLICDLAMPDLDGFTLIQQVRRRAQAADAHIPAIALTALAHSADRERALKSGFEAFVQKPFDPDELVRVVERWAARPR